MPWRRTALPTICEESACQPAGLFARPRDGNPSNPEASHGNGSSAEALIEIVRMIARSTARELLAAGDLVDPRGGADD